MMAADFIILFFCSAPSLSHSLAHSLTGSLSRSLFGTEDGRTATLKIILWSLPD